LAVGTFQFAAVILGAGRSSRMGQPKLLLPWSGGTILEHLIEQWLSVGASQVAVVAAADNSAIPEVVRRSGRASCITNRDPDRGMFSSVRCAAEWRDWNPKLTHWILSLGDQPHLQKTTLSKLIAAVQAGPEAVWQPSYQTRRRHPVVLPAPAFDALRQTGATDLRNFLESSSIPRKTVEVDDPGLEIDIDTPEDYARAKKLAGID
jgi:molybdenum cofactor cytidylyltransferase